jgi:hypothetical protein
MENIPFRVRSFRPKRSIRMYWKKLCKATVSHSYTEFSASSNQAVLRVTPRPDALRFGWVIR